MNGNTAPAQGIREGRAVMHLDEIGLVPTDLALAGDAIARAVASPAMQPPWFGNGEKLPARQRRARDLGADDDIVGCGETRHQKSDGARPVWRIAFPAGENSQNSHGVSRNPSPVRGDRNDRTCV